LTSKIMPLPLSTSGGVTVADRPTQNCHVALTACWAPCATRTRQYTQPVGRASLGTALRWSSAIVMPIASGSVHARSLHSSIDGVPSPGPSTQRSVGVGRVTRDSEPGAISRGSAGASMKR
jgi:hypothetical protein